MADVVSDMLSSESDKVAELLKDAYAAHIVDLTSVRCKVGELEKKCKKLEQRNQQLLHKGRDLQVKFDKMRSDYEGFKKEYDETKARVSMPCRSCQMLKGQLEQQEKLYNMMICNMYPDRKVATKHPEHLEHDFANQPETLTATEPNSSASPLEQAVEKSKNSASFFENFIETNENVKPPDGKAKCLKLMKRARTKYSEDSVNSTKKMKLSSPENNHLQRTLKSNESQQTSTDVLAPETCLPDVTEELGHSVAELQKRSSAKPNIVIPETVPFYDDEGSQMTENDIQQQTVIGVPGSPAGASTPLPSGDSHRIQVRSGLRMQSSCEKAHTSAISPCKEHRIDQHSDFQLEPSSPVFGGARILAHKQELVKKLMHSPSLFDEDHNAISVEDRGETDLAQQGMPHTDDAVGKSSSAVACVDFSVPASVDLSISHNESVSVLTGISGNGEATASSNTSKSMKGEQGIKHAQSEIWKNPNNSSKPQSSFALEEGEKNISSKRIAHSKLKYSKECCDKAQCLSDNSHDLDETRDSGCIPEKGLACGLGEKPRNGALVEFESEDTMKEMQIQLEGEEQNIGCVSSEVFTEPQFTSTQKCHVSIQSESNKSRRWRKSNLSTMHRQKRYGDSKEAALPEEEVRKKNSQEAASMFTMDANFNGTIDPNVHLSQYDSSEEFHTTKSAALSSDSMQTNSKCQMTCSQNPSQALSTSDKSAVFCGKPKKVLNRKSTKLIIKQETADREVLDHDHCLEKHASNSPAAKEEEEDSFDGLPQKQTGPGFAYVDVVRKRSERKKLQSYVCPQCTEYYDGLELSEEEKQERMKHCRHKARYLRPDTPEHYWSITFPDTQEAEEEGYLKTTQVKPSRFRRRRGLRPLFLKSQDDKPS